MATYTEIHIRRDSTLNWYASNPRLALGEPGVDMDLHRFKIGNGIDRWNELPYMDDDLYKLLDKTQQKIADEVQSLLNKINANKLAADQSINSITSELRNTSRDLTGRMTTVENEQAEYEEKLTARQNKYERDLTGDFEDTRSEVNHTLAEFGEATIGLVTRMDVIAGQATEDTEILDARVDAQNHVHPNLGHNIRSLHSDLLAERTIRENTDIELRDRIDETDENLQSLADKQKSDYDFHQGEISNLQREASQLFNDISSAREASNERDDFLQEQADTLANLAVTQAIRHESDVKAIRDDLSGVHGDISELQDKAQDLQSQSDTLNDEVNHDREISNESDSHLQEQINKLAEGSQTHSAAIYKEIQERRESHAAAQKAVNDEAAQRANADENLQNVITERGDFLQEQANTLANAVIQSQISQHDLEARTNRKIAGLEAKSESLNDTQTERGDFLQEQTNTLANAVIQSQISQHDLEARTNRKIAGLEAKSESLNDTQTERSDFLQEQINETSAGIITNAQSIAKEGQERRESARHIQEVNSREIEHLQEQTNDLASGIISLVKEVYRQHRQSKETLQRELSLRDRELERMREMIDDLTNAALTLAAMAHHLQTNQGKQKTTEKLEARLTLIEHALVEGGLLDPDYMDAMTDAEINSIFDGILNDGTIPEDSETTEDDEQVYQAIDDVLYP